MNALLIVALIALTAAPLFFAFRYGDQILDGLSRRTRQRRNSARRRRTRSLPIRNEEIERLLGAEEQRDRLDESIATNLEAFARLPGTRSQAESESELEAIERAVLDKESQFGVYLDYAWLQSETLEVLTNEVRLLRQLADLPEDGLPLTSTDRPPQTGGTGRQQSAADKLFDNLQRAQERKSTVDRKLRRVGSSFDVELAEADTESESGQPETRQNDRKTDSEASRPRLGGAFDAIVGDDAGH